MSTAQTADESSNSFIAGPSVESKDPLGAGIDGLPAFVSCMAATLIGSAGNDAPKTLDIVVAELGGALRAQHVELWISNGRDLRRSNEWHTAGSTSPIERGVLSPANFPAWHAALQSSAPATVVFAGQLHATDETGASGTPQQVPPEAQAVLIPLRSLVVEGEDDGLAVTGDPVGVLMLVREPNDPWSAADLSMVTMLSSLLPGYIERTRYVNRLVVAFDAAPSAMTVRNEHGVLVECNESFRSLLGHPSMTELVGSSIVEVIDLAEAQRSSIDWGRERTEGALDIPYLRTDGETVWGRTTTVSVDRNGERYTASHIEDITDLRLEEQRLSYEANHDELTGLLNRRALMAALERSEAERAEVTVLLIDLDGFKLTNDSLGHDTGDELLRVVAERLRKVIRPSDIVARLGGDEFVLVLPKAEPGTGIDVALRVLETLRMPVRLGSNDVFTGASIGIAQTEGDEFSSDVLLRKADIAMYAAKAQGKNCYEVFDQGHRAAVAARQALETDLRRAARNQSLEVYYQPIYQLESGQLTGAEALVRWRSDGDTLIDANKFIDVARDVGVLGELGEAALEAACIHGVRWALDRDPSEFTLRVNIGAAQLGRHGMVPLVRRVLECTGFPAANLCLEVSEDALMRNPERAQETLEALSELGVQLCVDSFGQGLGSILQLRRFNIDMLKIAPEIVWGVDQDPDYLSIAEMILLLANSMDLDVVADGIETEAQKRSMVALGVRQGQGYHLDVPLRARELTELIALHDQTKEQADKTEA